MINTSLKKDSVTSKSHSFQIKVKLLESKNTQVPQLFALVKPNEHLLRTIYEMTELWLVIHVFTAGKGRANLNNVHV